MEQAVEVTDLDAAHQVLSAAYGKLRIDGGQDTVSLRIVSRMLGPVRFDQVCGRIALAATGEPLGTYAFGHMESGRLCHTSDGEERMWGSGDVFLSAPPDRPYSAVLNDPRVTMVVLDQSVLDDVADQVSFTDCRPMSAGAAACWRSMCRHLRDEVLVEFAENPLVVSNAARLLVATTLATFPNTALDGPTYVDRRDGHPQTLRRAIAFIESNATRDITAADIAAAVRVSIRAVQLAFRRHLDTTPMAYLRRVRLSCADADLRAGNGTVTTIAARWGYARPSVFAAHYRAAYGTSPSRTLRSH